MKIELEISVPSFLERSSYVESLEPEKKKEFLDQNYPSQKALWKNDAKYYLFEGIFDHPSPPWIEVEVNVLGYHKWQGASDKREYLSYPHQHNFTVKLRLYPRGLDRELEFHDVRESLWSYLTFTYFFGSIRSESCEMMARDIYYWAKSQYSTSIEVFVSEEGNLTGRYGDVNGG